VSSRIAFFSLEHRAALHLQAFPLPLPTNLKASPWTFFKISICSHQIQQSLPPLLVSREETTSSRSLYSVLRLFLMALSIISPERCSYCSNSSAWSVNSLLIHREALLHSRGGGPQINRIFLAMEAVRMPSDVLFPFPNAYLFSPPFSPGIFFLDFPVPHTSLSTRSPLLSDLRHATSYFPLPCPILPVPTPRLPCFSFEVHPLCDAAVGSFSSL